MRLDRRQRDSHQNKQLFSGLPLIFERPVKKNTEVAEKTHLFYLFIASRQNPLPNSNFFTIWKVRK